MLERAGLEWEDILVVWASPPCQTFSPADYSNITRGHAFRDHSDPNKPPTRVNMSKAEVARRLRTLPLRSGKKHKALQELTDLLILTVISTVSRCHFCFIGGESSLIETIIVNLSAVQHISLYYPCLHLHLVGTRQASVLSEEGLEPGIL